MQDPTKPVDPASSAEPPMSIAPTEAEVRAADLEAEDAADTGKAGKDENAPGFVKPQEGK